MNFYILVLWIHLLAAFVWLGGMFFMSLVLAPISRRITPYKLRAELLTVIGRRFKIVGWISIFILLVTGILNVSNLWTLNILELDTLFGSDTGQLLFFKLFLVGTMLGLSIYHDFFLGPRMVFLLDAVDFTQGETSPTHIELKKLRFKISWIARVNVLIGILILLVAINLTR